MKEIHKPESNLKKETDVALPLIQAGELIKQVREEKNLSIEELAKSIRIGEEQLQAIENGEIHLLPEEVFIRAMILRVGEKLKIEKSLMLRTLSKEIVEQTKQERSLKKANSSNTRLIKIFPIIMTFIGITASVFSLNYIFKGNTDKENIDSSYIRSDINKATGVEN